MSRQPAQTPGRAQRFGKTAGIVAGLGGLFLTFLGLLFSSLYSRAVDCGVDHSACQTQLALQPTSRGTPAPAVTVRRETVQVTLQRPLHLCPPRR